MLVTERQTILNCDADRYAAHSSGEKLNSWDVKFAFYPPTPAIQIIITIHQHTNSQY